MHCTVYLNTYQCNAKGITKEADWWLTCLSIDTLTSVVKLSPPAARLNTVRLCPLQLTPAFNTCQRGFCRFPTFHVISSPLQQQYQSHLSQMHPNLSCQSLALPFFTVCTIITNVLSIEIRQTRVVKHVKCEKQILDNLSTTEVLT